MLIGLSPGARAGVENRLAALRPDPTGARRAFLGEPSWRIRADGIAPWAACFVLRDIVGCHDFGRDEKLAWEHALKFEGVPMTMAYQKFGLRAYVDQGVDELEASRLVADLIVAMSGCMPLLQGTVLASIADSQVEQGALNIDNRHDDLSRQLCHFRQLALSSQARAMDTDPVSVSDGLRSVTVFPHHERLREARFETGAALAAFFSLLEHTLLIGFMLSGRDATGGRLADFIGSGWAAKFKTVVDLSEPDCKVVYDGLVQLYGEVRNPAAHGEVRSDGADFSFLLPGIGPVSTRLMVTAGKRRTYEWSRSSTVELLDEIQSLVGWLDSGPLGRSTFYGRTGLPLFFGSALREDLVECAGEEQSFHEAIERIEWLVSRNMDMDW